MARAYCFGRVESAARRKTPQPPNRATAGLKWRGQDSNLRPRGYEPRELPGCSTARCVRGNCIAAGRSCRPSKTAQSGEKAMESRSCGTGKDPIPQFRKSDRLACGFAGPEDFGACWSGESATLGPHPSMSGSSFPGSWRASRNVVHESRESLCLGRRSGGDSAGGTLSAAGMIRVAEFVAGTLGQLREPFDNLRMVGRDIVRAGHVLDDVEQQRLRREIGIEMRMDPSPRPAETASRDRSGPPATDPVGSSRMRRRESALLRCRTAAAKCRGRRSVDQQAAWLPASTANVGSRSIVVASSSQTVPAGTRPGCQAIIGTRKAPSLVV